MNGTCERQGKTFQHIAGKHNQLTVGVLGPPLRHAH